MKRQPAKSKKGQFKLTIEPELHERVTELGARCGLSGNMFVVESLRRYGDILADAIEEEDKEHREVRERHRQQLRDKIQPSKRK